MANRQNEQFEVDSRISCEPLARVPKADVGPVGCLTGKISDGCR